MWGLYEQLLANLPTECKATVQQPTIDAGRTHVVCFFVEPMSNLTYILSVWKRVAHTGFTIKGNKPWFCPEPSPEQKAQDWVFIRVIGFVVAKLKDQFRECEPKKYWYPHSEAYVKTYSRLATLLGGGLYGSKGFFAHFVGTLTRLIWNFASDEPRCRKCSCAGNQLSQRWVGVIANAALGESVTVCKILQNVTPRLLSASKKLLGGHLARMQVLN